jgi:hypothetical protein
MIPGGLGEMMVGSVWVIPVRINKLMIGDPGYRSLSSFLVPIELLSLMVCCCHGVVNDSFQPLPNRGVPGREIAPRTRKDRRIDGYLQQHFPLPAINLDKDFARSKRDKILRFCNPVK